MNKFLQYFFVLLFVLPISAKAQFESLKDSVVQLYGVVMTADSLEAIPSVSIMVKGQNRGTISNEQGVFSIAVLKGDQVEFTSVGFKPVLATIPKDLEGNRYSIAQLMVTDTVYLPATIIRPRPTKEQFARDFVNARVPDDAITVARKNNDASTRRFLAQTLPSDGREASNQYLRNYATKLTYSGQLPPQNIFNPAAWVKFIEAWKRGDFKKKK